MNAEKISIVRSNRRKKKGTRDDDSSDDDSKNVAMISNPSSRSSCTFDMNRRKGCLNENSDSEPDRSDPPWKVVSCERISEEPKPDITSQTDNKKESLWNEIMQEYEESRQEYEAMLELEKPFEPPLPVGLKLSAVQYLEKHIFGLLCPILKETLSKAKEWDCLMIQKCRFNGLDYISELLWNRNPLHPRRHNKHRDIFGIPFATIWLHYNPRPIYPLSWLWTGEEAITVMQSYIRRYLVCRDAECFEMRQFWKTLKMEKEENMRLEREKYINETEDMFNEILDRLVADAVFEAEWKIWGCHCIQKPCHCVCKCTKWCKCCNCYKVPVRESDACACKHN